MPHPTRRATLALAGRGGATAAGLAGIGVVAAPAVDGDDLRERRVGRERL